MPNRNAILQLKKHISSQIIGQQGLVDRLLIALLADGHLLVEGAPGLAKTRAIKVLSEGIEGDFHRVQFTPDLLPADLTVADEINRAPAKVQAALLESMAERQITVGRVTYKLPELFLVMATQNPIEQDGTYPLPEAQLDRFLLHIRIDYPQAEDEKAILHLNRAEARQGGNSSRPAATKISQQALFGARQEILDLYMADNLEDYLVQIVLATRNPGAYGKELEGTVQYGASPRASIALDRCARAHAWLAGRDFVAPEDIQAMTFDVLRHRVLLSYEAEVEGMTPDLFVSHLLSRIAVP